MGEHAIFSRENFRFLRHSVSMVHIWISFTHMQQISNLRNPFEFVMTNLSTFELCGLGEGGWVQVGLVGDNVVCLSASIVGSWYLSVLRNPRCWSCHIFLISGLFDHLIKNCLKWPLLSWRFLTYVVSGVFGKTLRLYAESFAVERCIDGKSHFVGALGGPVGHFALRKQTVHGFIADFAEAFGSVDIYALLSHNKSSKIRRRIDPKIRFSIAHESLIGPDRAGLRSYIRLWHFLLNQSAKYLFIIFFSNWL